MFGVARASTILKVTNKEKRKKGKKERKGRKKERKRRERMGGERREKEERKEMYFKVIYDNFRKTDLFISISAYHSFFYSTDIY